MGASNVEHTPAAEAPSHAKKASLVRTAAQAGLGFPPHLIEAAFDRLIQIYGGVEEAWVWMSRDNFTVLVDSILEHQASGAKPDPLPGADQVIEIEDEDSLHSAPAIKPKKNQSVIGNEPEVSHAALQKSAWDCKKIYHMEKSGNVASLHEKASTLLHFNVQPKCTNNVRAFQDRHENSTGNKATGSKNCSSMIDTCKNDSITRKRLTEQLAVLDSSRNVSSKANRGDSMNPVVSQKVGSDGQRQDRTANLLVKGDQNQKVVKRSLDWSSSSLKNDDKDRLQKRKISLHQQSFIGRKITLEEQPQVESRCRFEKSYGADMPASCDEVCPVTKCLVPIDNKRSNKMFNFETENMRGSYSGGTIKSISTNLHNEKEGRQHMDDPIREGKRSIMSNPSQRIQVKARDAVLVPTSFSIRMGKEDSKKSIKGIGANFPAEEKAKYNVSMTSMTGNVSQNIPLKIRDAVPISTNFSVGMQEEASKRKFINSESGRQFFGSLEKLLRSGDPDRALNFLSAYISKDQPHRPATNEAEKQLETHGNESAIEIVPFVSGDDSIKMEQKDRQDLMPNVPLKKNGSVVSYDISRGLENIPISCVNEYNTQVLPEDFLYITSSVICSDAHINTSFSRIGDLHCNCSDDCLGSCPPCKCTDSTRGEYAYDKNGFLIDRLATSFHTSYATENGDFIVECCGKCRCSMHCGNRLVQRGITKKLQVFMTPNKKGWGVRTLELIRARSFVYEYIGEITTNDEQFYRNERYMINKIHTYTMNLDADFDMERRHFKEGLTDAEALVLDATSFGNVSRFMNHRCRDANLFFRPVQVETRDTHYYHVAFFAARDIMEMEELTWDYGIDFEDNTHQVKAFQCRCNSQFCRDKLRNKPVQASSFGKKKSVA